MIWLIGCKGMLGTDLSLMLESSGLSSVGTDLYVDITDIAALECFLNQQSRMDPVVWIVNCAAYTAVDKAEDDSAFCRSLNTHGAANVAGIAKAIGAKLIHISTDYVFNGLGIASGNSPGIRPYREDDPTDPIGVYGLTKRDGEAEVLANSDAAYIIRTAWLYGKYGNNFVATMLRLMQERDTVSVVNDQRGSPTWTHDLADAVITLIRAVDSGRTVLPGIYHYTNEGNITWFDFARKIYTQGRDLGLLTGDCTIKPCTSAEFPSKVRRPVYSVLDKTKIKAALGLEIPPWDQSLEKYLKTCAV
ncbi:MAG: dTDP-4-dehydrorhamnose reductase [Spirochaetaceae bacterium]|jgi:dTDP-4-dehydrorhamnose reductase|nr:dTDP-4-dehydrorhamnose reductase [Spirochaetaceae bacterium]